MATKYEIGDKVVLTSVDECEEKLDLRVGMEGTIAGLFGELAQVSFKGWHNGHTNEECSIWYVMLEK